MPSAPRPGAGRICMPPASCMKTRWCTPFAGAAISNRACSSRTETTGGGSSAHRKRDGITDSTSAPSKRTRKTSKQSSPAMLKIKVEGYQEAKEILDEMPNRMQKQMLRSALKKSSKPFVKGAQSRVPVKSGQLKKQLKVVSYRDRQAPKTEVDVAVKHVFSRSKKKKAVNEYYGKFVHEGTRDPRYPKKKGGVLVFTLPNGDKVFARHVKGLKPRPYIEESYQENYQTVVDGFGDSLAESVEKFVSKNFKPVKK